MQRTLLRLTVFLAALAFPVAVLADAPPNITGLAAHFENGQITVHWDAPGDTTGIASYRIYYGQKSILENDGAYDDFASTASANTSFILTDIPQWKQIYFGVLAVNANNEESASFVEELKLDLGTGPVDGQKAQQEAPSPSRKQRESTSVGLTGAVAQSANSIGLTFSMPIAIPVQKAVGAFSVIDDQGNTLQLRRIVIQGSAVTLTTGQQFPGRHYAIRVNDVVTGQPGPGTDLPVDTARNTATFDGFNDGSAPTFAATDTVPAETQPAPGVAVVRPAGKSLTGLTHSGAGTLGVALMSGAVAGWWKMKRKKEVEELIA